MFPRNENRNEGTFAKTTLLETALVSTNDPFWCSQKGGFQKGGFGGCSPGTKTGTRVRSPKPPFYETALLSPVIYGHLIEGGCEGLIRPLTRTNVQQLTCKMIWSVSFYSLLFSFIIFYSLLFSFILFCLLAQNPH